MARRPAADIQAEIDVIKAELQSSASIIGQVSTNTTTVQKTRRKELEDRLDVLYAKLGRADGSDRMLMRGVPQGLR